MAGQAEGALVMTEAEIIAAGRRRKARWLAYFLRATPEQRAALVAEINAALAARS